MESERLKLRPFNLEADFQLHIDLMNTENWLKYIGDRNIHTKEDYLKFYEERMKPIQDKGYTNFVIQLKDTHEKIGTCGIYKRDHLNIADIGYALLPKFEGFGYVVEAALLVIDDYFQKFSSENKIAAFTSLDNLASQRVLEKLNFTKIDVRIIPPYEYESVYFEYSKK